MAKEACAEIGDAGPAEAASDFRVDIGRRLDELLADSGFVAKSLGGSPRLGDGPTLRSIEAKLADLSERMLASGCSSEVTFQTTTPGAAIRYVPIARRQPTTARQFTNDSKEVLPIGIYHVWSERGGQATSDRTTVYRILQSSEQIAVDESR